MSNCKKVKGEVRGPGQVGNCGLRSFAGKSFFSPSDKLQILPEINFYPNFFGSHFLVRVVVVAVVVVVVFVVVFSRRFLNRRQKRRVEFFFNVRNDFFNMWRSQQLSATTAATTTTTTATTTAMATSTTVSTTTTMTMTIFGKAAMDKRTHKHALGKLVCTRVGRLISIYKTRQLSVGQLAC